MKIALASDHAGFELKEAIKPFVGKYAEVIDFGTSSETSIDYPDTGFPVQSCLCLLITFGQFLLVSLPSRAPASVPFPDLAQDCLVDIKVGSNFSQW